MRNIFEKGIMDLHNHTVMSDGCHTAEEIIKNAIRHGIQTVGITDHFESNIGCVDRFNFEYYDDMLRSLKEKFKGKIRLLRGGEICANQEAYHRDLPFEMLNGLDYILFEHLDYSDGIDFFQFCRWVDQVKCMKGLAHTDLFVLFDRYGKERVLDELHRQNIFWELNVSYPYFQDMKRNINIPAVRNLFEELKVREIDVSVGSDTHSLVYYNIEEMMWANGVVRGICS